MHCVQVNPIQKEEVTDEEDGKIKCFHCMKEIQGKPWIIVSYPEDNYTVYGCKYLCSRNLNSYLGPGYWNNVVNKGDFPGPRPVSKNSIKEDITVNFGIEEIRKEIENEDKRITRIEMEYENIEEDSSDTD